MCSNQVIILSKNIAIMKVYSLGSGKNYCSLSADSLNYAAVNAAKKVRPKVRFFYPTVGVKSFY